MNLNKVYYFLILFLFLYFINTYKLYAENEVSKKNMIAETNPIYWVVWGANIDAEINYRMPVSFIFEYQHIGSESILQKIYIDKYNNKITGNIFSIGLRYYPFYKKGNLDGIYFGLAFEKLNLELTTEYLIGRIDFSFAEYYDEIHPKTKVTGYGARAEIGWRKFYFSNISVRYGFNMGYIKNRYSQSGYEEVKSDDKKNDRFIADLFGGGILYGLRAGFEFCIGIAF